MYRILRQSLGLLDGTLCVTAAGMVPTEAPPVFLGKWGSFGTADITLLRAAP